MADSPSTPTGKATQSTFGTVRINSTVTHTLRTTSNATHVAATMAGKPIGTAVRRKLGSTAKRPTWPAKYEAVVAALRSGGAVINDDPKLIYKLLDQHMPKFLMAKGVHREDVKLPGIDIGGEWFWPAGRPLTGRCLLYLHGGAFMMCTSQTYRHVLSQIVAATDITVLAPNYRSRQPENPWPEGLEDALTVYTWLIDRFPPSRIVLAGDSAGGGLCLALMMELRARSVPLPAGVVLYSPWVDLTDLGTYQSWKENEGVDYIPLRLTKLAAELYSTVYDPKHPLISPIFGDFAGLPPMHVEVGEAEVLRDQGLAMCDRAEAAGVTVTRHLAVDMVHVFPLLAFTCDPKDGPAEPLEVFQRTRAFIEKVVPSQASRNAPITRPEPIVSGFNGSEDSLQLSSSGMGSVSPARRFLSHFSSKRRPS